LDKVFPKLTIDLLESVYDSVQDIDLYVGGALESFTTLKHKLLGPTFSCIFRDQYRRMTSGDAYFFSHATNPNPFTPAQLKAIQDFSVNQLICTNSQLESVNKQWHLVDDSRNPKVPCSKFQPMDLKAWKDA
jgi:peroxidase